jgi:hypothetical protein
MSDGADLLKGVGRISDYADVDGMWKTSSSALCYCLCVRTIHLENLPHGSLPVRELLKKSPYFIL